MRLRPWRSAPIGVYRRSGKGIVVEVSDAVRIDGEGLVADRSNRLSFVHVHWGLEQNASGLVPSS
jgi:hypothetical protein